MEPILQRYSGWLVLLGSDGRNRVSIWLQSTICLCANQSCTESRALLDLVLAILVCQHLLESVEFKNKVHIRVDPSALVLDCIVCLGIGKLWVFVQTVRNNEARRSADSALTMYQDSLSALDAIIDQLAKIEQLQ